MGERERAVVDELLVAESVKAAQAALLKPDANYDVDALEAELAARRDQLNADGRQPEAELVSFLIDMVRRHRSAIDERMKLRDPDGNGPKRTWPTGFPDRALSPRMALERRVSDLVDSGELDDALLAAHQANEVPCADRTDQSIACTSRWRLASALRKVNRSREAYEVLEAVEFTAVGHSQQAKVYTDFLAVEFYTLQGLLREDMGYYRRGRSSYQAARDAAERAGDAQARIYAWINLAASYMKSHKYRQAVREWRRLLQFAESLPDPRAVVAPLTNLGRALLLVGEYEAARSCYQRVLTVLDQLGVTSTSRSAAWFGLGDIAYAEGDGQGAVDAYINGYMPSLGTDGARISLFDLAQRLDNKDLPEHNPLFGMVLAFSHRVPGAKDDWHLMMTLRIAIARFCARQHRYYQAVPDLRELREESLDRGIDQQSQLSVTNERAKTLIRQASHHHAMAELDGIVRLAQQHGTSHLLHLSDKLDDELTQWQNSGRPDEQTSLQEAFNLLWQTRTDLVGSLPKIPDAIAAMRAHQHVYQSLVDILIDHGDVLHLSDTRSPEQLAFDLHEEFKAHGFLTHLAYAPMKAPDSVPAVLRKTEADLLARLSTSDHPHIRDELAEIHERIAVYAPSYVRLRRGHAATLSELRNHLRSLPDANSCAFVSFLCGEETTTVFTYLPDTDRLTAARSPLGTKQIKELADRLRSTFDGEPDAFPPKAPLHPRRPWRRSIDFLAELTPLLEAFLPHVHGRPLLYVSCDGPLHGIPLPAIPMASGDVLAAQHAVVHIASASAMLYAAARHSETQQDTPEVFCVGVAAREDSNPAQLESDPALLSAAGWPVTALTGTQATRQTVLRALGEAHIAHITCHGYFDRHEPLDSGLLLAQAGKRPSKLLKNQSITSRLDHLLTVRDIARGALQPYLLTMRACATGLRDEYSAEDLEGLVQALLYTGVNTIVASLWNVDERSSRQLLTDFYRRVGAQPYKPVWRAFWDAQRTMIEQPESPWQSHPYHWAALALFGDWRKQ